MASNKQNYDSWRVALEADKGWAYDKYYLKFFVVPFLLIYCAWVMIVPATQEPILVGHHSNMNNSTSTTKYLYISPEGVRMTLNQPFDKLRLLGHSVSGVIMILCSLIQKHSASFMLKRMTMQKKSSSPVSPRGASSASPERQLSSSSSSSWSSLFSFWCPDSKHILFSNYAHKNITSFIMLSCLSVMSIAGFIMRSYVSTEHVVNFNEIMYAFVSPWIILGSLIYFTAKFRYCRLHVLIGNALLWSCFAVVFARLLGGVLQRMTTENLNRIFTASSFPTYLIPNCMIDLGDGPGYYAGIASSTVIFGVFLSVEAWLYFERCRKIAATTGTRIEEAKKRSSSSSPKARKKK